MEYIAYQIDELQVVCQKHCFIHNRWALTVVDISPTAFTDVSFLTEDTSFSFQLGFFNYWKILTKASYHLACCLHQQIFSCYFLAPWGETKIVFFFLSFAFLCLSFFVFSSLYFSFPRVFLFILRFLLHPLWPYSHLIT